ncbi:hypothetical protein Tco_0944300 [Tanacetum coccineum]
MAFCHYCLQHRPGLCYASYSVVVGFDCSGEDHHTFFSFLPDVQHRHGSYPPSTSVVNSFTACLVFELLMPLQLPSIISGNPPIFFSYLVYLFWEHSGNTSRDLFIRHHVLQCCPMKLGCATSGVVVLTWKSTIVLVPPGSVVVPPGSVVTTGSVVVPPGSVVTTGSILLLEMPWDRGGQQRRKTWSLNAYVSMSYGSPN